MIIIICYNSLIKFIFFPKKKSLAFFIFVVGVWCSINIILSILFFIIPTTTIDYIPGRTIIYIKE